ncbi:MAG: PilZ domain-containing protein [Candidatus Eremiobacteraeota bacterium]|nr:PilZ domain-containing protein [Candidatus Eremiobacteraeota bacterium]
MKIIDEMRSLFNRIWGKRLEHLLRERRNYPRKPCDIPGIFTYQQQSTIPLVIKDISLYGMLVHSGGKLTPGSNLLVSARGDSPHFEKSRYEVNDIYMTVSWCRKSDESCIAGLQYNDLEQKIAKSWLGLLLQKYDLRKEGGRYRRKTIRMTADIPVTWRLLGGEKDYQGKVVDISLEGVLIEADRNIEARQNIRLLIGPYKKIPPLTCRATIIHTRHARSLKKWFAGVSLDDLNEAQEELLQKYLTDLFLTVS